MVKYKEMFGMSVSITSKQPEKAGRTCAETEI